MAHDIFMCYAPLTKKDLENLERGHPKRFILPMTTTQITTMTTFIAQSLFGDSAPHKVEARGPEDETAAEHINQLLRWNSDQQAMYLLGYLWIQDILVYNRGIFYNSVEPIYEVKVESEMVEDEETLDAEGKPTQYSRPKRVKKPIALYNKAHLVSPYDFVCDPALPLCRMQEMRFTGHRVLVPWQELKRRSLLDMDDPAWVSPAAIEKLKSKDKAGNMAPAPGVGNTATAKQDAPMSRTAFERTRTTGTNPQQNADANDPGMVEVHEMWIRMVPEDNELWEGDEPVIVQFQLANQNVVLSVNESTLEHDMYPYSAAEGRPSAYYQFSPSWVGLLKSLQDYVDYFKNRRQQSIARTLGNVFIARTDSVNLTDFLNPDKDGLIIPVLPEASGEKLDDIIKQVQVNDNTSTFNKEMADMISFAESATAATSPMQGQLDPGDTTATQFSGTQQMGAGRLASVSRLISVQGLVPQTKQFVANFKQFWTTPMSIRFTGSSLAGSQPWQTKKSLFITHDVIQGNFDFVAHDGTLPGTDVRKVSAIARLLEAAQGFPQFFTPEPGNIDARALLLSGAKASGLNIENFQYSAQAAPASGPGEAPPLGVPALPNIGTLTPPPAPPGPGPGRPSLPDVDLTSAAPPQIRPQNA